MDFERVVYSPGMTSPEPVKKPRKNISAPSVSAAGAAMQAASAASKVVSKVPVKAAKATVQATVKVAGKGRKVADSDEDEEGGSDIEVVQRTPKPTRQRSIKSYVQEESEEEDEESEYESS